MVFVWLLAVVGFTTLSLLAIAGALWAMEVLGRNPAAKVRSRRQGAAEAAAEIRALAWATRLAMLEQARRHQRSGSGSG